MLNNLREKLRPTLEKIGKGFASTGLSANFWTFVGLGFALVSAIVYGMGIEFGLIIGGVLLLWQRNYVHKEHTLHHQQF